MTNSNQLVNALMAAYRVDEQSMFAGAAIAERNRIKQLNTVRDRLDQLVAAAKHVREDFRLTGAVSVDGWIELEQSIKEADGEGDIMKHYEEPKLTYHGKLRNVTQFSGGAVIESSPAPPAPVDPTSTDPPAPHAYITSD